MDANQYQDLLHTVSTHLKNAVELRREHHIALRLQLAAHERLLTVELALRELSECVVGHDDRDVGLCLGLALVHRTSRLEVDSPDGFFTLFVLYS